MSPLGKWEEKRLGWETERWGISSNYFASPFHLDGLHWVVPEGDLSSVIERGVRGAKLMTAASYSKGNARGKFDPGVSNFGSQRWGFGTVN